MEKFIFTHKDGTKLPIEADSLSEAKLLLYRNYHLEPSDYNYYV